MSERRGGELTPKEREHLARMWEGDRHDDPPLSDRDFHLINWALECLHPISNDPRPGRTLLEIQRVCILAAKKILETGCTKEEVHKALSTNQIRYAFKKGEIGDATIGNYLYKYRDERPERYLREGGLFPPASRIEMAVEEWEFLTQQPITDGAPQNW